MWLIIVLINLTLSKYIVLSPRIISNDDLKVEILEFDTPNQEITVEVFNALDQYCWSVQGDKTRESLIKAGCTESEPFTSEIVNTQVGWNSIHFDLSSFSFQTLFLIVSMGEDEFVRTLSVGESSQDEGLLIQSDKSLYKPGETVSFRVIPIRRDLSVFSTVATVKLTSPDGMLMAEWTDISIDKGFMKGEFPLDADIGDAFIGTWTISVTSDTLSSTRTFDVEKYILQRFSTTISPPSYALSEDRKITVTVRGEYTYGEGVQGTARLQYRSAGETECWGGFSWYFPGVPFTNDVCGWTPQTSSTCTCNWGADEDNWYYATKQPLIELTAPLVAGDAEFEIDTDTIDDYGSRDVCFRAYVEEDGTASTEEDSTSLLVDKLPYKVVFEDSKCVPGFDYETTISFADPSGAPFSPPAGEAVIKVYKETESTSWAYNYADASPWDYNNKVTKELIDFDTYITTRKIDTSGGTLALTVDKDGFNHTTFSLIVEVHYGSDGKQESVLTVDCLYAKDYANDVIAENRIRAKSSAESGVIGDTVSFAFEGTTSFPEVYYLLTSGQSKGPEPATILQSGQYSGQMDVLLTIDHVPEIRFTVFALDGTLLADYVSVPVNPKFGTISAQYTQNSEVPDSVLPGANVDIELEGEASTTVLVGIVDSSLLLMSTPNDITSSYALGSVMPDDSSGSGCTYYLDANQALDDSGLMLLASDFANIPSNSQTFWGGPFMPMPFGGIGGGVAWNAAMPEMDMAEGAGAIAYDSRAGELAPQTVQQRSFFPESWIWMEYEMDSATKTIQVTAPDTITSWTMTAVSLGPNAQLGIAENVELTTFKPFFISLALPYEVIREEEFDLNMTLFNYLDDPITAQIECDLPTELLIPGATLSLLNDLGLEQQTDGKLTGTWTVAGKTSLTRNLPVRATTIGDFPITITAVPDDTSLMGDSMTESLRVSPEGVEEVKTNNVQLEGPDTVNVASWHHMKLTWPEDRVVGSESMLVSLTGDVMGATVANLGYLIRQPTGCGEQNMLYTAPQVYVFNYLKATDQLSGDQQKDIVRNLHTGYTRELTYMHSASDQYGGFSAFGDDDESPSTWLTAFVAGVFMDIMTLEHEVGEKIVDPAIIGHSLTWLFKQQTSDGRFAVVGRVIHKDMTGGVSDTDSLTCYVASVLVSAQEKGLVLDYADKVDRALNAVKDILETYLNKDLTPEDIYAFSICAHAYVQAHDDLTIRVYNKLELVAKTSPNMKWWDNKDGSDNSFEPQEDCWDCSSQDKKALAVELTSYNLLTIMLASTNPINGRSAVNWLMKQRNENGGFESTQDTCMGLKALSQFASAQASGDLDLTVEMKLDDGSVVSMSVDDSTTHLFQLQALAANNEYPEVSFQWRVLESSVGTAYLGVTQRYHFVPEASSSSDFNLDVSYEDGETDCGELKIDANWMSEADSGMVIINGKSLSGCCFVPGAFTDLKQSNDAVRRVDHSCDEFTVYYDHMTLDVQSFSVPQVVDTPVKNAKGQSVYVQQYYNPTVKESTMYNLEPVLQMTHAPKENISSFKNLAMTTMGGMLLGIVSALTYWRCKPQSPNDLKIPLSSIA